MMKPCILPSILSADFSRLGEEVRHVLDAGADMIHFDVMDNHFVPNLTIGPCVLESLRKQGMTAEVDVHLMIKPVDAIVPAFAKAGATYLSFHPEATDDVSRTIALIRSLGVKPALVLNPDKPLTLVAPYLAEIDMLLIMSVYPGFGGQAFMPDVLTKAKAARLALDQIDKPIRLEIDGGIKVDNIALAASAGIDTFVAGSAIFGAQDYRSVITAMRKEINRHTTHNHPQD